MRKLVAGLCAAMLVACGSGKTGGGETADMAEKAPGVTAADFAGTWTMSSALEGTEQPVLTTLTGSADGSAWSLTLPDRDPVAVHVSVSGDSLIGVSDPYESVLRKGVTVTVRTALVRMGDEVHGTIVATYQTAGGEEVVNGTMQGTRAAN